MTCICRRYTVHSDWLIVTDYPCTSLALLSKGLNFVPISKKLDEFSVKQDVEKFIRHVQLKAFLHDKEDDSNTSDKDIFETLQTRKSKWTPPEGQFASLDFFRQ